MSALEILVRGPNWTGDLVMATPGFRALRAGFPAARITLHVAAPLAPLVAGAPWFDAVVPLASRGQGARALLREARTLRRAARFGLGLCLPDSFESALLMRLAGVQRVVSHARGLRRPLLHQAVPVPSSAGPRRAAGGASSSAPAMGKEVAFFGEYREILPPERFVWTFGFDGLPAGEAGLETYTFIEAAGKTTLVAVGQFKSIESRDAAIASGMEQGAAETWDRLADLLRSMS